MERLNWVVGVGLNVSGIPHLSKLPSSQGCSSVEVERLSFQQHLLCYQSNLVLLTHQAPLCLSWPHCLGDLHFRGFQNHHLDLVQQLHYLQFHLVFVSKWGTKNGRKNDNPSQLHNRSCIAEKNISRETEENW